MFDGAAYKKQWALNNAEKVKEQKRACYLRNKERYDAASKAWAENNPEFYKERYERIKNTPEYKAVRKAYAENNKEYLAEKGRQYREDNKEAISERRKRKYKQNRDVVRERNKQYYEKNKESYIIRSMLRTRQNRRATPAWARKGVYTRYKALRTEAMSLEQTTGTAYHVDHICPIAGSLLLGKTYVRLVSGLNVDYNLQLLPADVNLSKNCFYWPDMWEYTKEDLAELAARSVPCDMELPRFNIKDYKDQEDM